MIHLSCNHLVIKVDLLKLSYFYNAQSQCQLWLGQGWLLPKADSLPSFPSHNGSGLRALSYTQAYRWLTYNNLSAYELLKLKNLSYLLKGNGQGNQCPEWVSH